MFYDRVLAAGDLFASLFLQFICFSQSFTIIFVLNKLINTKRLKYEQKESIIWIIISMGRNL